MPDPDKAAELRALQKFSCPACGAEAVWTPAKRALVCPYCGTVSPAELNVDGNLVEELDLAAALRSLPEDQRGWAVEKKTVRCQSCQAISVFDPRRVAQNCDFCGSPALIALEDTGAPIRPGSLLPFKIPDTQVREQIRAWYGSHFWARSDLGGRAMTDLLHGLYIPYWTFDAHVVCPWRAESGRYYQVRGREGRMEQRVEWTPASGLVKHFFDDVLVPASRGVHPKLLEGVAPFPTTSELLPYDPGYVSGWVVEQYQIDLVAAAQDSRRRMEASLQQLCVQEIPGDTYRNLQIQPNYSGQTFKHVLLPVWLLSYQYGRRTYQVAVNGFTGKITGEYPISWVKVALAILIGLIILALFAMLPQH